MKKVCLVLATFVCISQAFSVSESELNMEDKKDPITSEEALKHAKNVLNKCPVIDGHNDLPGMYRIRAGNDVENAPDLNYNISLQWSRSHTDIPRLRAGQVGGQIFAVFVGCRTDAVRATLEQMDVVFRMMELYGADMELVTTSKDLENAMKRGKIAVLVSIEGGHQFDSSLGALRVLRQLGVTSATLTHFCSNPWVTSEGDVLEGGTDNGLSQYGKEKVIPEMNRIGMLVDASHVSYQSMNDVLDVSLAPIIFSHSSAYSLCNDARNVKDDVLRRVAENGGIVMATFVTFYLGCYPSNGTLIDVKLVADHIEYMVNVAGIDHIGLGSDFDGIPFGPIGLEDVSGFPNLFAELILRGWSDQNLCKLSQRNFLRVFKETEKVSEKLQKDMPLINDWIPSDDLEEFFKSDLCRTADWQSDNPWARYEFELILDY